MARRTRKKLVDLEINETSGVDHPAHLHEGWLVMKEFDASLSEAEGAYVTDDKRESEVELETTDTEPVELSDEATVDVEVVEEEPVLEPVLNEAPPVEASISEDVRKEVEDLRKALDTERGARQALEAERSLEKAVARCQTWAVIPGMNAEEFAPVLCAFRDAAPAAATELETLLDSAATALDATGIFKEIGSSAESDAADAWSQITNLANGLIDAGRADSLAKAVSMVSSENPDLYARYRQEQEV